MFKGAVSLKAEIQTILSSLLAQGEIVECGLLMPRHYTPSLGLHLALALARCGVAWPGLSQPTRVVE